MSNNNFFGEQISSYSRRQAIEDGVLVDLSNLPISRQHWKMPIVCTSTVWELIQDAIDNHSQDLTGTLHDMFCVAKIHIEPNMFTDRIYFNLLIGKKMHELILHCGPGDTPMAVLTIMTPHDD